MKNKNPSKYEKHFPSLSDKEVEAINLFRDMLDQKFLDIKREGKFSALEMCDLLSPYLENPYFFSKLHPGGDAEYYADNRHINMDVMVAMRRIFGIDINALIDGVFQNLPPRKPPQK